MVPAGCRGAMPRVLSPHNFIERGFLDFNVGDPALPQQGRGAAFLFHFILGQRQHGVTVAEFLLAQAAGDRYLPDPLCVEVVGDALAELGVPVNEDLIIQEPRLVHRHAKLRRRAKVAFDELV